MQTAVAFYDGMVQGVHDADMRFLPLARTEFAQRQMEPQLEMALNQRVQFSKVLAVTGVSHQPIPHATQLFRLEFFACISALNLYRLPDHAEQFKAERLAICFAKHCANEELEWLGVYSASLPRMEEETGFPTGQWRNGLVRIYLDALGRRSSLDADTEVAAKLLLERLKLSKSHGHPVTPALIEKIAAALDAPACWLEHYLKYHPL